MKYLLLLIVWFFKSKYTISKWYFKKNVSRSLKCVCFIKKCRCVLCLVLSSLHTYSFGCFWVKLYVFDDVCVVVVDVVAVHSYHQFSEIFIQLSSSLVHVVCVCTLGMVFVCYLSWEISSVWLCVVLHCAWDAFDFSYYFLYFIFILQLLVFIFLLLLFSLLLTANGVYVAMVEFFFYLCRLYATVSHLSLFRLILSIRFDSSFSFKNSVYRIWCFVHFISFIKSVFTSIGASLLPLFFSLLVICASVCIYICMYVCLFSSFSSYNNSKEMMKKGTYRNTIGFRAWTTGFR